jgi:hypothetical protein
MVDRLTLEEMYGMQNPNFLSTGGAPDMPPSKEGFEAEKQIIRQVPEIIGGIGGSALGTAAGGIPGGFALGIAGTAAGKEFSQRYLGAPEKSTGKNIYDALIEETVGRATMGAIHGGAELTTKIPGVKTGVNFIHDKALLPIAERLGLVTKDITPDIIKTSDIFPTGANLPDRTVAEAQTQALGERVLTPFEETAGKRGGREQGKLESEAKVMQQFTGEKPNWQKAREDTMETLKTRVTGDMPLEKIQGATFDAIKKDINFQEKQLSDKIGQVDRELMDLAPQVNVNTQTFIPELAKTRQIFRQKLGSKGDKMFDAILQKYKARSKANGTLMDAANLRAFKADMQDMMGNFADNKDVQKQAAGVISDTVNPILDNAIEITKNSPLGQTPIAKQYLSKWAEYSDLAKQKGELLKNPLIRKLGARESTQVIKNLSPDKFSKIIMDDPKAYEYVRTAFAGKPEILNKIHRDLKTRVFEDVYVPGKAGNQIGGFDIPTIGKYLSDPRKLNFLKQIDPEGHLPNELLNVALIQRGLNASAPTPIGKGVNPTDEIFNNAAKAITANQTSSKVSVFSALYTKARQLLGGSISDKKLYEMLKGEKGQKLIERSIVTPLNSPQAYNLYAEIIKEYGKYDKSMNQQQFDSGVAATIHSINAERDKLQEKK